MYQSAFLLASFLAANVAALPLNINLGAYSPALVVGDGSISFGGNQDVSNLMNALEGAAVSGAAANGAAAPAAAAAAAPAASPSPSPSAAPAAAAANVVVPTDTNQGNTQITALQGMGKEIAPRIVPLVADSEDSTVEKRDINGFNAALNYATGALKTSPKVQLGTGEAGSGDGILQDAGGAPAAAAPAKAARDLVARDALLAGVTGAKLRTTVTTMFVRGGPAPVQAETRNEDGSIAVEKRAPAPALTEGVNLNMAEGQVAELTFVETRPVGEDDE